MDSRTRLLRVLRARHCMPPTFTGGQFVYVWRHGRIGSCKWFGSGVIILPSAGGAWMNMRRALWRASNEQMWIANPDESEGIEIANRYHHDLRIDLERTRGARRFVDVAREACPIFPGGEPLLDPEAAEADDIPDDTDVDADQKPRSPPPE
eukprot:3782578-Pyramimonas_sp.AAC.1